MSDSEALERRLSAVERAIADGDGDVGALAEAGDRERRLRALADRVDAIEETIADLEAATQALRGYVGNVRSVNADVEQRADAALAAVERLEDRLGEGGRDDRNAGTRHSTVGSTDEHRHSGGTSDRRHTDTSDERRSTGTTDRRRRIGTTDRNGRPRTHGGTSTERGRSADGDPRSNVDGLDTGPEMPVPGAENWSKPSDRDERRTNGDSGTDGDGVIDRVRDAL